jgi:hypothetical protein
VADANGALQVSEGLAGMAFAPAGSLPFVGSQGGEIVGFHGPDATGSANQVNALLYYDFASRVLVPVLNAGTKGVAHIDSIAISGHSLFLEEMSTQGNIDSIDGLGTGAIYEFDFATPEPRTFFLALGVLPLWASRKFRSGIRLN